MTTQERKAHYEAQFKEVEQHIARLTEELQKGTIAREQIRGKYLAMEELEAEEAAARAWQEAPKAMAADEHLFGPPASLESN